MDFKIFQMTWNLRKNPTPKPNLKPRNPQNLALRAGSTAAFIAFPNIMPELACSFKASLGRFWARTDQAQQVPINSKSLVNIFSDLAGFDSAWHTDLQIPARIS